MLVRWRPLVFVSSSIQGLESVRDDIRAAIEQLQLADVWLFEYHGVAAGGSPSRQYLRIARQCDMCVVAVGDDVRAGTLEEYEAAFSDNPDKILPFLFGEAGPGSETFRQTLRRHRFREVPDVRQLPDEIATAVQEYLTSGEIVRPALIRRIDTDREARRRFVGVPAGFAFRMSAVEAEPGAHVSREALTAAGGRFIVSGAAGSGKSDLVAELLTAAADEDGRLPLLISAAPNAVVEDWIAAVFDSVRFAPGPELIREYLRGGRLIVAVDGVDDLGPVDRVAAYTAFTDASRRYPRTCFLLLSRLPHPPVSFDADTVTVSGLTDAQINDLFGQASTAGIQSYNLDVRLRDLVRLPFWAVLTALYGQAASSPIDLLDTLVSHRISSATAEDAQGVRRIRAALAALAFGIRPTDRVEIGIGLDIVVRWLESESGRMRHGGLSADQLLEQGRRSGIISLDSSVLRFPHPLVAVYLAAEHAVTEQRASSIPEDDDLFAFVATICSDSAYSFARDALSHCSIFGVATFLRLARTNARPVEAEVDLERLDEVVRRLSPLAGLGQESHVSVLVSDGYVFVRRDALTARPSLLRDATLHDWLGEVDDEPTTIMCWRGDPFARMSPEQIGGQLIVNAFKRTWERLRPEGNPYPPPGTPRPCDPSDARCIERLVEFLLRARDARRQFLGAIGLVGSPLDHTQG
ncbi:MAG: DUF4062 domain-containing protein, partial [Candidatus Limnocylindrales bacterium]